MVIRGADYTLIRDYDGPVPLGAVILSKIDMASTGPMAFV